MSVIIDALLEPCVDVIALGETVEEMEFQLSVKVSGYGSDG